MPASLIFLPFRLFFRDKGEKTLFPSYSTGLSCGSRQEDALYHGLCECIERDAFLNLWFNRLPCPQVDIHSDPEISALFDRYFNKEGLEYFVVNATTDVGMTSIICFILDRTYSPPLISAGGCAGLFPRQAVFKALLEAAHTYLWARSLREKSPELTEDFSNIATFDDHVAIHASGKILQSFDFVFNNTHKCRMDQLPAFNVTSYREAVSKTVSLLKSAGLYAYAADLTSADVAELGLRVVRTFVPELIQLNAGAHLRHLGNRRLFSLPRKMGFTAQDTCIDSLNPFPHPYP
jgi:ribosomal protein S12 methylthiotransferase accessory factor